VPGFKLPPMMFTDDEAQTLSLGLIAVRGLGLSDIVPAVESVQVKLDRMLPDALKRANAALRETIAFHATGSVVGADTRLLRVLSEAAGGVPALSRRGRHRELARIRCLRPGVSRWRG
jgi:predicted DNA-binding transcriptional regulator YafY